MLITITIVIVIILALIDSEGLSIIPGIKIKIHNNIVDYSKNKIYERKKSRIKIHSSQKKMNHIY